MNSWVRVTAAELRREWRRQKAYPIEFFGDQVLFVLGFLLLSGLFLLISKGRFSGQTLVPSLVGYTAWRVADGLLLRGVASTVEDATWGTLEQIWLSPVGPYALHLSRGLVHLAFHAARALVTAVLVALVLGLNVAIPWPLFTTFLLTEVGVLGATYILIGLQLVTKRIDSIVVAFSTSLLFVTGALVPLDAAPWLMAGARWLPLGLGVQMMQRMAMQPERSGEILFTWGAGLAAHTIGYCLLGYGVFTWARRVAETQGTLGQY